MILVTWRQTFGDPYGIDPPRVESDSYAVATPQAAAQEVWIEVGGEDGLEDPCTIADMIRREGRYCFAMGGAGYSYRIEAERTP